MATDHRRQSIIAASKKRRPSIHLERRGTIRRDSKLPLLDTISKELQADSVTKQDSTIAEGVTKQDSTRAETVTKQDSTRAESVTKQDSTTAEGVTKQDSTRSESVTKQERPLDSSSKELHSFFFLFFFFIRTSNFGAEAERSYLFWQFGPEKFLRWLNTVFVLCEL